MDQFHLRCGLMDICCPTSLGTLNLEGRTRRTRPSFTGNVPDYIEVDCRIYLAVSQCLEPRLQNLTNMAHLRPQEVLLHIRSRCKDMVLFATLKDIVKPGKEEVFFP